jgi:CheY-like chemotaxis protein
MPRGGKLTVGTANVALDEAQAREFSLAVGDYVMLAVTDTGTGMNEETKLHLFEPFFTTKEKGKGTGLGLATCYGIVSQSGGHIRVDSELGKGTTFWICLPRVAAEAEVAVRKDEGSGLPQGTETILLVEDEPAVRQLASIVLGELGYAVLEASDGEEALRVLGEQSDRQVRLLITDVVLPQMDGKELADRLRASHPEIKVLFCSGYTDDAVVDHGVSNVAVAFLQKPFTAVTLAQKVREVLDAGT